MTNSADPDPDLDLHCLLRQGMSCSAREGLNYYFSEKKKIDISDNSHEMPVLYFYLFRYKEGKHM